MMKNEKIKLGRYRHYKGHVVRVLGVAKHSETLEDLVVYDHLGTDELSDLWVRPLQMFLEDVEVEGKRLPRFEFIGE
jgi:hypothetical protein